jgi:hypothetical protein
MGRVWDEGQRGRVAGGRNRGGLNDRGSNGLSGRWLQGRARLKCRLCGETRVLLRESGTIKGEIGRRRVGNRIGSRANVRGRYRSFRESNCVMWVSRCERVNGEEVRRNKSCT